jgi:hypothetical protein
LGWSLVGDLNKTISRSPVWSDTDTAADWQNNTTPSPNPCLHMMEFNKSMKKGWNLISIPVNMTNRTIENVLSSVAGEYTTVRAYDPVGGWTTYESSNPGASTLHDIVPEKGYWINMTQDAVLNVTGKEMAGTQIPVSSGWNLIGYPTFTVQNVSVALAGVSGNYTLVRAYDPVLGWMTYDPMHPEFSDLLQLSPGSGYWIEMTATGAIII